MARSGEHELAQTVADELRLQFGDGRSGRVAIKLMMLEALVAYFRDLSQTAYDRMSRAHLLSSAGRDRPLIALTSAWLAHIDFNLGRYREMTRAIETCIGSLTKSDGEALSRLSLTMGDILLYCDQQETAKAWYSLAREEAVRLGDHASIGALTYNQAALGVFVARLRALHAPISPPALALLAGEVKTAANYQSVARLRSLPSLLDNADASIRILQSEYARALVALDLMISSNAKVAFTDAPVGLRCDRILCLANLERIAEAERDIRTVEREKVDALASDDRAIAYSSLAAAAEKSGHVAMAEDFRSRAALALSEHHDRVGELIHAVRAYVSATAVHSGLPS